MWCDESENRCARAIYIVFTCYILLWTYHLLSLLFIKGRWRYGDYRCVPLYLDAINIIDLAYKVEIALYKYLIEIVYYLVDNKYEVGLLTRITI